MSRNELQILARITLVITGFYVILQVLFNYLGSIAMMPFIGSDKTQVLVFIAAAATYIVIIAVVIYFLFRCANRYSAKIVESVTVDETQTSWLAVAFRLVFVIAGVLFLYWTTPNLIVTVFHYVMNTNTTNKSGLRTMYTGMSSVTDIVKYVTLLGFSLYLAYGAPAFVRWQVRMTLKQCGKIEEQQLT